MNNERLLFPDCQQAAEQCGRHILELLKGILSGQSTATLAISGGSSPRPMFEYMAKASFDWSAVHIFWVDERAVPPSDAESNFRLAKETLLDAAHIPSRNIHRIEAELKPDEAAARYADELRSFFQLTPGTMPTFDVMHRGIGPDAHTASLFPGEPMIDDRKNLAAAVWVEKMKKWRITMLPGVLLAARHTAMLVCGADKAEPLKHIFEGPVDSKKYPAQLFAQEGGNTVWFLEAAAAKGIEP